MAKVKDTISKYLLDILSLTFPLSLLLLYSLAILFLDLIYIFPSNNIGSYLYFPVTENISQPAPRSNS